MSAKSCCTPSRNIGRSTTTRRVRNVRTSTAPPQAISIPGGRAYIGTDTPIIDLDGEGPLRRKTVKPFHLQATTVTNAQFAEFVDDTGYTTDAERYGWSFVFWAQVPKNITLTQGLLGADWWRRVDGAYWKNVNGPGSEEGTWLPDHPVVQVSWNDARAYCDWAGGRLPTEAEWEHAARGGLKDVAFPWGDQEPDDEQNQPCNIWQGQFPQINTALDGYVTTAPAKSFAPNGYGLYNMVGNVWEWTSESFKVKSLRRDVKERLANMKGYRLSKGGSFLCHKSYCFRYRIASRSGTSPDSATTHHGFRIAWD